MNDTLKRQYEDTLRENERLWATVRRIDAINDNPACYNPEINAECDKVLRPELLKD